MKNKSLRNRITILTAATSAMMLFPTVMNNTVNAVEVATERPYIRPFNPATVQTIKGSVVEVKKIGLEGRENFGVHLTVKTEKGPIEVHVGPSFFLEKNKFQISENESIEVTGSMINEGNKNFIIASDLKIGDKSLKLRDAQGIPLWRNTGTSGNTGR